MNTQPIVAATLAFNQDGLPWSAAYQDIYHPQAGAFTQAQHVFLAGNELPQRWQQRHRFVILETGFGLGNNFLATWLAWQQDTQRCERLVFVSIEQHPFTTDDLRRAHAHSPSAELARQLVEAWPPLTHNLHTLSFENGNVQLLLALGNVSDWLPEIVARVDAFYLDGFAPAHNPQMWQSRLFKALARLAAPDATLATWTAIRTVHDGLRTAGFAARKAPGKDGRHDITVAHYAPTFAPRSAPSRLIHITTSPGRALIVGAGLAGCATALALAAQGWRSTVFDRHALPAQETSGNPGGLFHGIVNAQDGTHARFNRAASLQAQQVIRHAVQALGIEGSVQGLLRLDEAGASALHAVLDALGLPPDYVRAVDAAEASALCGIAVTQAAWFYPGGGWVQPGGLARAWMAQASPLTAFHGGVQVSRIRRVGPLWQLLDEHDQPIDEAEVLVLANAGDALRLLGWPDWPVEAVRGQISLAACLPTAPFARPRLPIAGAGYLLPETHGQAIFGASSQPDDMDGSVRLEDHRQNLAQLSRLLGTPLALDPSTLQGRTGWRWVAQDKLPVIGAVPDAGQGAIGRPLDQPRFVPRVPGLYVITALGSRGITWSPLGAQTLAALITGAPVPLESSLLDAIDPARFVSRAVRLANRVSGHTPAGG